MDKNSSVAKIKDPTIDKSDTTAVDHSIKEPTIIITNFINNKNLTTSNIVRNPFILHDNSNMNDQTMEKDSMTIKDSIVNSKRDVRYTKVTNLIDGRQSGPKKIRKAKNLLDKYVTNRSTNKFCLDVYSKIKNSLSTKDKKLFSKRVKTWFQIETAKLDKKDPLPKSRVIKQAPMMPINQRFIEPIQSVRIFDFHFVLDTTCLHTDKRDMLPKQMPFSHIKNVKAIEKLVIDKKEGFYRIFLRELNSVEGKFEYCQNEIEFLKKWLLNLSNTKAKDFCDLLSEMTSPQNFLKLGEFLEISKGTKIEIKKLNADTLKYIKKSPSFYSTYEVNTVGNSFSLPTCTEFGMNESFCKITMQNYHDVKTSNQFKIHDSFVIIDQFVLYTEFFKCYMQTDFTFQEKGVQDPDMIFNHKSAYAITSYKKKLNIRVNIFIEKYAENGVYYETVYIVFSEFKNVIPKQM